MKDDIIGMIGISLAGRDAGRSFAVISRLDDEYVLLADGGLRRVDKPKRKKLKHIRFTGERVDLSTLPANDTGSRNACLRRLLACFVDKANTIKEG